MSLLSLKSREVKQGVISIKLGKLGSWHHLNPPWSTSTRQGSVKTGGCGSSLSPSKRRAGKEYSQSWCLFFLLRAKPVPKGHHDWEKILSSEMEAKTLLSQPWNIFRNRSFQLFLPSSSLVNISLCLLLDLCSALWGRQYLAADLNLNAGESIHLKRNPLCQKTDADCLLRNLLK